MKGLDLSKCDLTSKSIHVLADFLDSDVGKKVVTLDLSNNEIDSAGIEDLYTALGANKTLKKLDLESNIFDEEGVLHIRELISQNSGIVELNLCSNFIGKNVIYLTEGLRTNKYLRTLDLEDNNINGPDLLTLFTAFYIAKEEDESTSESDVVYNRFTTCSQIEELNLSFNLLTHDLECFQKLLSRNKYLKSLTLNYVNKEEASEKCRFSNEIAKGLVRNRCLEKLSLDSNDFDYQDMVNLQDAFQKNRAMKLRHLSLKNNNIDESGIKVLIKGLTANTSLVTVDVSGNHWLEEAVAEEIQQQAFIDGKEIVELNPVVQHLNKLLPRSNAPEAENKKSYYDEEPEKRAPARVRKFAKKKKDTGNIDDIKARRRYSPGNEKYVDNVSNEEMTVVFDRETNSTSGQKPRDDTSKQKKFVVQLMGSDVAKQDSSSGGVKKNVRRFKKKHNKNLQNQGPNPHGNAYNARERHNITKDHNNNLDDGFESVVLMGSAKESNSKGLKKNVKKKKRFAGKKQGKKEGGSKQRKMIGLDEDFDSVVMLGSTNSNERTEKNTTVRADKGGYSDDDQETVVYSSSYLQKERMKTFTPRKEKQRKDSGRVIQAIDDDDDKDDFLDKWADEEDEALLEDRRRSILEQKKMETKRSRILAARSIKRSNDKFLERLDNEIEKHDRKQKANKKTSTNPEEPAFGIIIITKQEITALKELLNDFVNVLDREENNLFKDSTFQPNSLQLSKKKTLYEVDPKDNLRRFAHKKGLIGKIKSNLVDNNGVKILPAKIAQQELMKTLVDRRIMKNVCLVGIYDMLKRQIGSGITSEVAQILPSTFIKKIEKKTKSFGLQEIEDFESSVLLVKYVVWNILKVASLSIHSFKHSNGRNTPTVGDYVDQKGRQLLQEFGKTVIEEKNEAVKTNKEIALKCHEELGRKIINHAMLELIDILILYKPMYAYLSAFKAAISFDNPNPSLAVLDRKIEQREQRANRKIEEKIHVVMQRKKLMREKIFLEQLRDNRKNRPEGGPKSKKSAEGKNKLDKVLEKVEETRKVVARNLTLGFEEASKASKKSKRRSVKRTEVKVTDEMQLYRENNLERIESLMQEMHNQNESLKTILSISNLLPFILAFCDFKELTERIQSRKVLANKMFSGWLGELQRKFKFTEKEKTNMIEEIREPLEDEVKKFLESKFPSDKMKAKPNPETNQQENYINNLLNTLFSTSRTIKINRNLVRRLKDNQRENYKKFEKRNEIMKSSVLEFVAECCEPTQAEFMLQARNAAAAFQERMNEPSEAI
eukprot:augustus_masked-scaffold_2-processed-gene-19.27-mRNA-1 protein AED:0.48 eAED:1.00 QI:0/-1/0/1/-1/1/1/0/1279